MYLKNGLLLLVISIALSSTCFAQQKNKSTFDLGIGAVIPTGNHADNWKEGFHLDLQYRRSITPHLYFTGTAAFELVKSSVLLIPDGTPQPVQVLGVTAGVKVYPARIFYLEGGAGVQLNLDGNTYSKFMTGIFKAGAGLQFVKNFGVFANYNIWSAAQQRILQRFGQYISAGVRIGFSKNKK